jgi:putative transposase
MRAGGMEGIHRRRRGKYRRRPASTATAADLVRRSSEVSVVEQQVAGMTRATAFEGTTTQP